MAPVREVNDSFNIGLVWFRRDLRNTDNGVFITRSSRVELRKDDPAPIVGHAEARMRTRTRCGKWAPAYRFDRARCSSRPGPWPVLYVLLVVMSISALRVWKRERLSAAIVCG
ncbi:hypothetical protein [Paraburkholderia ribeironis]|nr:hypothetical protein [Paraburkholderia ribeironis]